MAIALWNLNAFDGWNQLLGVAGSILCHMSDRRFGFCWAVFNQFNLNLQPWQIAIETAFSTLLCPSQEHTNDIF